MTRLAFILCLTLATEALVAACSSSPINRPGAKANAEGGAAGEGSGGAAGATQPGGCEQHPDCESFGDCDTLDELENCLSDGECIRHDSCYEWGANFGCPATLDDVPNFCRELPGIEAWRQASGCGGTIVEASGGVQQVIWTFDADGKLVAFSSIGDVGDCDYWGTECEEPPIGDLEPLCGVGGESGIGGAGNPSLDGGGAGGTAGAGGSE